MSIRPADMQNMIHRTTQVERVENNEKNAMQHSMQRTIDQQQQQITKTVVNVAKESKDGTVNKDGHTKQEYERKNKKKKKQEKDNEKYNRNSESMFDVSV